MNEPLSFGDWLQRRRKAHGLTQAQLGQLIGCSTSLIRKIEADERRPSLEIGARLAAGLHVAVEERASLLHWARRAAAADLRDAPPEPRSWLGQRSPAPMRGDIPRPATALIGRGQDVAAVQALLASTPGQLITLVGPPGIGKTRLSLAVAAEASSTFPDGLYFVPLAAIRDPELLLPAIAQALGVHQTGGQPLIATLRQVLAGKQVLLVLDNVEQIVAAAPLVDELLALLPNLRVLVTSRVPLHVYGEQEYAVPPLAVPELRSDLSLEALSRVESVRLFVQRAAQFDFRLTPANAAPVAAICRRLDGLPLAIELAAARIKVLPPEALLRRLADSLDVLTGGAINLPPRHRTLRNAIAWSFDLLPRDEQVLLRRLAVFAGGWTLEAAEAIGATGGSQLVLDTLQALIDKSLVQRVSGLNGEPRFGMLELIREFALEQLWASGEQATLQARHAAYFVALAETAKAGYASSDMVVWLDRIEADHENLRAALRWLLVTDPPRGLWLAGLLGEFWEQRSQYTEGSRWLADALHAGASAPPGVQGLGCLWAALLAWRQGQDGRALAERSLALYQVGNDRLGTAWATNALGLLASDRGDTAQARALWEDSLTQARGIDAAWGARSLIAILLINLGNQAVRQGDLDRAYVLSAEGLELAGRIGNQRWRAYAQSTLGLVALKRHDTSQAQTLLTACIRALRDCGQQDEICDDLEGLAIVTLTQGTDAPRQRWAARLFGAAAAQRERINRPIAVGDGMEWQRELAVLRPQLDADAFAAAWEDGRAMPLAHAIAEALDGDTDGGRP